MLTFYLTGRLIPWLGKFVRAISNPDNNEAYVDMTPPQYPSAGGGGLLGLRKVLLQAAAYPLVQYRLPNLTNQAAPLADTKQTHKGLEKQGPPGADIRPYRRGPPDRLLRP